MGRTWKPRTYLLVVVLIYSWPSSGFGQAPQTMPVGRQVENSVFWQISGKDLSQPSYLFGTFHLMGARYIDSLTHVMDKFSESKTLVGELVLDSTMTVKMMVAARLHET